MNCPHGNDSRECYICRENADAQAKRTFAAGAARRAEIARIAAVAKRKKLMEGISVAERKAERHAQRSALMQAAWDRRDTKAKRIRAILTKDPERSYTALAQEIGTSVSFVSVVARRSLGFDLRHPKATKEARRAALLADASLAPTLRRVRSYLDRGYRADRIAQLLGAPETDVAAYIDILPEYKFTHASPKRRMTPADVEAAVQLWKDGHSYSSAARKLGLTTRQVTQRLTQELTKRGEK